MKRYVAAFFKSGLLSAVGGPVILAIVYLCLYANGVVEQIDAAKIAGEILTVSLMAGIAGGITVVYKIERLSLFLATLIHGTTLYLDYIFFYLLNGWIDRQPLKILIFTGIFVAGYAGVWLMIFLIVRRNVKRLNQKLTDESSHSNSGTQA